MLAVGGIAVAHDTLSLGTLIAFYAFVALIVRQLAELAPALDGLTIGVASLAQLEELLADDTAQPYRGSRRLDFRGGIAPAGVGFGYDAERRVVSEIDLRIEPGERVAIVGPSGAGKSTVVSLIAGLYRPSPGHLAADGVPYDELDLGHLRHSIGIALQDPIVFSGTVLENIAYGRGETSEREATRAARSGAAGFVESLPDGLDTERGEEGVRLSGGQRQRLAIARALVHEPPFLVLDEPSTYLDRATIEEVMANLASLPHNPAILVVTHDPEVAEAMDRIVRLRDRRLEQAAASTRSGDPRPEPEVAAPGQPDTRVLSSGHMGRGLALTAQALRCNERTLRRYVNDGVLRADRAGGREVRIPFSEERYLREHWHVLHGLRRALRTEHDVRLAVLFGSTATGEDHPDSDVDLLIEHRGGDLRRIVRLRRRLQAAIGRRVHLILVEDAETSPSLLADVIVEGRVIVDRDGTWPRLQRRRSRLLREADREEALLDEAARRAVASAGERIA